MSATKKVPFRGIHRPRFPAIDRRTFIKGSVATGAAVLAGGWPGFRARGADPEGDCGVASGDPLPDSVVIWTRVPLPYQPSGSDQIAVSWEVSRSESFATGATVRSGVAPSTWDRDWTVCVRVSGLEPFTRYYYRFSTDTGYDSVVGRTLTAPDPNEDLDELRFAYVSCQHYATGYYNVYDALTRDDVHFCIHLGDTIYEGGGNDVRDDDIGEIQPGNAITLADYRNKYKLYLSDPRYREARRLFPWITLWDDHEVVNNYAGADLSESDRARQLSGYQAFREYIPMDPDLEIETSPSGVPSLLIYRKFQFGGLLDVIVMDQRQYRLENPCAREYGTVGCQDLYSPEHTMLGLEQRQWVKDQLSASTARWRILANEVVMMEMKYRFPTAYRYARPGDSFIQTPDGLILNTDQWDGYPVERRELLEHIRDEGIDNVVVITGDIHNCYAGDLRTDFTDRDADPVAVEVVGGSITSAGAAEALGGADLTRAGMATMRRTNPHIKWLDLYHHVYTRVTVTRNTTFAEYIAVDTIASEEYIAFSLQRFMVEDGRSVLIPIT